MSFLLYIHFFIVGLFSFFVPGFLLINFLNLKFPVLDKLFLSVVSGTSLFLIFTYAFAFLNIPYAYLAILAVLNFYFLIHYSSILKKLNKDPFYSFFKNNKIDWISVALLSLGTVLFSYVMFFSGLLVFCQVIYTLGFFPH
jgi:hypothetical protein